MIISTKKDQVFNAVTLCRRLPRIITRTTWACGADVTDCSHQYLSLDNLGTATGKGAQIAGERVQAFQRRGTWSGEIEHRHSRSLSSAPMSSRLASCS